MMCSKRGMFLRVWQALLIAVCGLGLLVAQAAPPAGTTKAKAKSSPTNQQEITLNFADADIRTVIEAVADRTGKNFIIDPRVKGKVTVISKSPMKDKALYQVLLSVLKIHGYAAIPGKNAIKIVPEVNAKQDAIETITDGAFKSSDAIVTQVIEVKHVDAAQLVPILRPLVPQRGHLAAYPASNVLIISDSAANISRISTIIKRIDQATGDEIEVIPLQHASATEVVRVITQLEGKSAGKAKNSASNIIADERTNSILLGGAVASRVRIRALIGHLDTPMDVGGHTHVVYLKNAVAKDLVPVLTGVSKSVVAGKGKQGTARASATGSITIQADENTNALVINAPPDVFRSLRTVIQKLDIRRAQVLVEAVIAEVSTNAINNLGVSWIGDGSASNNPAGIISFDNGTTGALQGLLAEPPAVSPVGLGLSLGVGRFTGSSKVGAVLNALAADSSTNILSTPNLVTLDNQEAEIVVGDNVPFITGSTTSTTGGTTNPFTTIERKDIGLKLKIKPQINEGNAVKMDVEHEVSDFSEQAGAVDLITTKRSIKTSVMVDDGQTLVLGGLIKDTLVESEDKVPFFGDIPIIGWLFRSTSTVKAKINLMVFLHPTILKDAAFNAKVTHDKYQFLRSQQLAARERHLGLMDKEDSPLLPDIKDFMILPAPFKGDGSEPSLSQPPAAKGDEGGE